MAALGLLACSPGKGGDDDGSASGTGTGGSETTNQPTTGGTGGAGGTGGTDTGGLGTGRSFSSSATQTEDSVTVTDDTGVADTGDDTTGTGTDTGEVACDTMSVPADQGFTDPPVPSGFESCNGGILHRVDKAACEVPATPSSCMDNSMGGCASDDECVEKPFGSCQQDMVFGGILIGGTCSCVYGCQTDDDCADGQICRCGGDGLGLYTECVQAGCTHDSDCPPGELCGLSPDICAPGGFLTACTTPADLCSGDNECANPPCMFDGGKWDCANAACGRPFMVETHAVTAEAATRDDWRAVQAAPAPVDAALADRLAQHWTQIARLEHASVAAFAQFVLQLLAVGAPPELVLGAQRALADEVEHARLCFGLASLYSGTGVGPGPLPIAGLAATTDLATLVDAVVRGACLGETLAAFEARDPAAGGTADPGPGNTLAACEARDAAAQAQDPAVRAALRKIAGDEQRHAELGWQFLQWALAGAGADVARARRTFADAIAEARAGALRDAAEAGAPELRAHGVVDAPLRAEVWAHGLAEVIEPCAAALLERLAA